MIIEAPMAGGGETPRLVAAVCEAGALGTIGAGHLSPEQRQTLPARPRCLDREGVAVAR
jgi:NAD(P)H-dependent flavin oxidoreductase YrpB (nitropropane dioxygenase family)